MKVITILFFLCLSFSAISAENKPNENKIVEIILFPVNLIPNIISNTFILMFHPIAVPREDVSNLWPLIVLTSPIAGPVAGGMDAWHGYPFWDPAALDFQREYK